MKSRSLSDLKLFLEKLLSNTPMQDHGPNGLQVEGKREIQKIGTAVSASLSTIEKAMGEGVDVLIVHHGLFWNGDPYPIEGSKKRKIETLLKNNVSLFAYHLPLDAHRDLGNNWRAAKDLGWRELEPFCEYKGAFIGVKGRFDPISIEEFQGKLERYYGNRASVAKAERKIIQSAGLVSGGAYRELKSAKAAGLDAFVTGNFDEPAWSEAQEENVHFLALGHTATEKVGPKALAEHIAKEFGLTCTFIDSDNPF
jgi:dinuclear metal center YbgI/SA1388 family protein